MNSREEAERLYKENEKLVHGALNKYFPSFALDEDIQQVARCGLWKACLHYDAEKSRFSTVAYKFVANEVRTELRKRCRKSEISTISLNSVLQGLGTDGMDELDIMGVVADSNDIDWCDAAAFWESLTERQRFIVKARLAGSVDTAIAEELGVSHATVIREKNIIRRKAEKTL